MSKVPCPVELRTVIGPKGAPVSQFVKFSNVFGLGELMYSVGEIPDSSAAARVKTLKVEPACMPIVPPWARSVL